MTDYPPGLTCERTVLRLEQYLVSALPRAEALAVSEHIEACASCAQRLVLLRLSSGEAGTAEDGRGGRRG